MKYSCIPTANFCDLDGDPSRYDGKVIRVRAPFVVGGETRITCAKKCKGDA